MRNRQKIYDFFMYTFYVCFPMYIAFSVTRLVVSYADLKIKCKDVLSIEKLSYDVRVYAYGSFIIIFYLGLVTGIMIANKINNRKTKGI